MITSHHHPPSLTKSGVNCRINSHMHCPLESLETVVERYVFWVISKCSCFVLCMDHDCTVFFLRCYSRSSRQCFLFDIAIVDHCMYVNPSWGIKLKFVETFELVVLLPLVGILMAYQPAQGCHGLVILSKYGFDFSLTQKLPLKRQPCCL